MKLKIKVFGLVGMGMAIFSVPGIVHATPFPVPELVTVHSDQIFAPPGFDTNDVAQIVLHGTYMNSCYHSAQPEFTVDQANFLITVTVKAYVLTSCWCAPVLGTFTQPVDLGVLPAGKYRVVERSATGAVLHETTLSIAPTDTATPDSNLYAPVKSVQIVQSGSDREMVLTGQFSSDCLELQEVKALHRSSNIVEILPIANFKTGTTCNNATSRPFEARVKLPITEPGDTLFHVRVLNGQAINWIE